jgi:HPt (histidine-containing phosphotransfer) domain-containing protein
MPLQNAFESLALDSSVKSISTALAAFGAAALATEATQLENRTRLGDIRDRLVPADGQSVTTPLAQGLYAWTGSGFDRMRGDVANGLDVDVTRLPTVTENKLTTAVDRLTALLAETQAQSGAIGRESAFQPMRALQYARDSVDRMRVVADAGRLEVERYTRRPHESDYGGYPPWYGHGAQISMDPREQHREATLQSFRQQRGRWTFT